MCLRCFLKLITIGPPPPAPVSEENEEEENQNTLAWLNLDLTPMTNEEEATFWGMYREQKLDDFLRKLSDMLPINTPGVVDINALTDSFWDDPNFMSELEEQWQDEIGDLIRTLTESHSNIDHSS